MQIVECCGAWLWLVKLHMSKIEWEELMNFEYRVAIRTWQCNKGRILGSHVNYFLFLNTDNIKSYAFAIALCE